MLPDSSDRSAFSRLAPVRSASTRALSSLEHQRGRLVDLADVLLGALDRVLAHALGFARRVLGRLRGVLARVALDRGRARLGGFDDRLHLGARDGCQRLAGAAAVDRRGRRCLRALQRLDITGKRG
jgi:hypothetical protein